MMEANSDSNHMAEAKKPVRLLYPDAARAFGITVVAMAHICGGRLWELTPDMWQFRWLTAADTLAHCAVQLFVMISGMFLLSPAKNVTWGDLFKKYILRMAAAYVGWSFFYAVFTEIADGTIASEGWKGIWSQFVEGHYHLWFLPMMAGIYLTVPFFRAITEKEDERLLRYVLSILIFFNVVHPVLDVVLPDVGGVLWTITPSWFGMYATYFFAGYYFSRAKVFGIGKYIWLGILAAGAGAVLWCVFSGSAALGMLDESQWSAASLPMTAYSIAVFMAFRNFGDAAARFPWMVSLIRKLSKQSFAIYLCHDVFITIFAKIGFDSLTWHPAVSVPLLTAAVLLCSMLVSRIGMVCRKFLSRNILAEGLHGDHRR